MTHRVRPWRKWPNTRKPTPRLKKARLRNPCRAASILTGNQCGGNDCIWARPSRDNTARSHRIQSRPIPHLDSGTGASGLVHAAPAPVIGYFSATPLSTLPISYRQGYRERLAPAGQLCICIALVFETGLSAKIPAARSAIVRPIWTAAS